MSAEANSLSDLDVGNVYPYTLTEYRSLRTIISLDMLGPDISLRQLFDREFRTVLGGCSDRIDAVLDRARSVTTDPLPDGAELKDSIEEVCTALEGPLTLQQLLESNQGDWPESLAEKTGQLYAKGFYINFQMVPDDGKEVMRSFFSSEGDDFLGNSGDLTLKDYFEVPRSEYTQAQLDILYKARRLGVLICHESSALSDDKGKCWTGTACRLTSDNKVCTGNNAGSDPC